MKDVKSNNSFLLFDLYQSRSQVSPELSIVWIGLKLRVSVRYIHTKYQGDNDYDEVIK